MGTRAWGVGILLVSAGIGAASQDSPYERSLQSLIASYEKIGAALKTIVDEESANAAKPELRKSAAAVFDARAKASKLEPPEKDEKLRLEKQYRPKLEKALNLAQAEARRVELIPGGKGALKEIAGVLRKESKK